MLVADFFVTLPPTIITIKIFFRILKRLVSISVVTGMLVGGALAMGYQMSCDQDTEDEQVVEQKSMTALPDSVKSEMSLQLEREALMERVRAIYSLVKQESV